MAKTLVSPLCFCCRCSPNIAHFALQPYPSALANLPVCRDYCDDWFQACQNDITCVENWVTDWVVKENGSNYCPENATCRSYRWGILATFTLVLCVVSNMDKGFLPMRPCDSSCPATVMSTQMVLVSAICCGEILSSTLTIPAPTLTQSENALFHRFLPIRPTLMILPLQTCSLITALCQRLVSPEASPLSCWD